MSRIGIISLIFRVKLVWGKHVRFDSKFHYKRNADKKKQQHKTTKWTRKKGVVLSKPLIYVIKVKWWCMTSLIISIEKSTIVNWNILIIFKNVLTLAIWIRKGTQIYLFFFFLLCYWEDKERWVFDQFISYNVFWNIFLSHWKNAPSKMYQWFRSRTLHSIIIIRTFNIVLNIHIHSIYKYYNIHKSISEILSSAENLKNIEFGDFRSNSKGISIKRNSSPVQLLNRKLLASVPNSNWIRIFNEWFVVDYATLFPEKTFQINRRKIL